MSFTLNLFPCMYDSAACWVNKVLWHFSFFAFSDIRHQFQYLTLIISPVKPGSKSYLRSRWTVVAWLTHASCQGVWAQAAAYCVVIVVLGIRVKWSLDAEVTWGRRERGFYYVVLVEEVEGTSGQFKNIVTLVLGHCTSYPQLYK